MNTQSSSVTHALQEVTYRKPQIEDGTAVWQLIADTGVLDLNSPYCYLMLSAYFAETCIIALLDEKIVGYISAFCSPSKPDTLFVWQVAVDKSARGKGVGTSMLHELLERDTCASVQFLETTVSPSNAASEAMFRRLARERNAPFQVREGFSEAHFPDSGHEAERLFLIGPFHH